MHELDVLSCEGGSSVHQWFSSPSSSGQDDMTSQSLDELMSIDSQLLLNTADECFLKDSPTSSSPLDQFSPFLSDGDFQTDFFQSGTGNKLSMDSNDYASTHSSDSGKHSPSGSESLSDQHSPWVFPIEPSTSQYEGGGPYQDVFYSPPGGETNQYDNYSPESDGTRQEVKPKQGKVFYIVPKTATPHTVVSRAPSLQFVPAAPRCSQTVLIKSEPPPTPATQSVYITTAQNMKSIPVLPCSKPVGVPVLSHQSQQDYSTDDYQRKREDRKMKNRAAAQASRLKKKYEVDIMSNRISELELENSTLRRENTELRERLGQYERGGFMSTGWSGAPSRKRVAVAGACVMALFMMVSVSPIGLQQSRVAPLQTRRSVTAPSIQHGRVLAQDAVAASTEYPSPAGSNVSISCGNKKMFFNKTETIRLNTDLYNWVERHEQMDMLTKRGKRVLLRKNQPGWPAGTNVERVNVTAPSDSDKRNSTAARSKRKEEAHQRAIRDRTWKHLDMISHASDTIRNRRDRKELRMKKQLSYAAEPTREQYEKLASTIQQRSDTLYIVTMKDYFLLPALERNATSRPRLAVIMPALSINGTLTDQVPMMRIDLDVVGTGLFHLPSELAPIFFN